MKQYIAIIKQRGEGCDYTIGCGMTTKVFEADSMEGALNQLRGHLGDDYLCMLGIDKEREIEEVLFFEASAQIPVPWKEWKQEVSQVEQARQNQKQLDSELREYERLKQKFHNWT